MALVIGNARYPEATLNNPELDARVVSTSLQKLGFDVTTHVNLGAKEFKRVLREYGRRLEKEGAVAVFFYAGHGVQIDGRNYLLPVDINLRDEDEVKDEGVDIDEMFVSRLERSRAPTRIVILDACRDNPFGRKTRSVRAISGLAAMGNNGNGILIAYSSAPGATAEDGPPGTNSAFTKHLAREMLEEGVDVEQMLKKVKLGVLRDTQNRQMPWHTSSLTGDFYFNPKPKGENPEVARLKAALEAANGKIAALTRDQPKPAPPAPMPPDVKTAKVEPKPQPAPAMASTPTQAPAPALTPALKPEAPKQLPKTELPKAASSAPRPAPDKPKIAAETRVAEAKPQGAPKSAGMRSERCVDLLTRAQLGEPLSGADLAHMQKECR